MVAQRLVWFSIPPAGALIVLALMLTGCGANLRHPSDAPEVGSFRSSDSACQALARCDATWCRNAILTEAANAPRTDRPNWQPMRTERLVRAALRKRPVLVQFTADWCVSCQALEKTILNTPDTAALVAETGVLTLEADWTNEDDEIRAEMARLGYDAIPLYVVYAPDGTTTVLRESLTASDLEAVVRKAATAWPATSVTPFDQYCEGK